MLERIARLIIGKRHVFLIGLSVITLFFLYQIRNIDISTKFSDLLPYSHPYIKTHQEYVNQLGDPFKVYLMLKVKEGNIYNIRTLQKIKEVGDSIDAIPGINHDQLYSLASSKSKKIVVEEEGVTLKNIMEEVPKTEKEAATLREIVRRTEGVHGIFVSQDEKSAIF